MSFESKLVSFDWTEQETGATDGFTRSVGLQLEALHHKLIHSQASLLSNEDRAMPNACKAHMG